MENVVLFNNIQLPEGSAAATRVVAFAHILEECGYHPMLLGVNYKREKKVSGQYEGITYELLDFQEMNCTGIKSVIRKKALKRELLGKLHSYNKSQRIKFLFITDLFGEISWLLKDKELDNICIVNDVVEWYDWTRFSGVGAIVRFLENRFSMHVLNVKCKNIIGISSLLTDYYKGRGCHTIRIPTILDTRRFPFSENICDKNKIIIGYAGSPAKKDLIVNMARAFLLLSPKEREKFEFRVYGADESAFINLGLTKNEMYQLKNVMKCFGRIPFQEVKKRISEVDYTVLLRPNKRYANAGFPTKVGESMALGRPVIANYTSDIGLYLHDGVEGIVCISEGPEDCVAALRKIATIPPEELAKMKANARTQAEKSFDYRRYVELMKAFLDEVH